MNSRIPRSEDKSFDKTVDVTKYIFRSPNPNLSLFIFFIFSILLGFILTFDTLDLSGNFEIGLLSARIIGYGLITIGIPTIITAIISSPIANILGGRFYYRRSVLLVSVSILLFSFVIIICKILTIFIKIEPVILLIFGYASIFILRHSALVATSHHSHFRSMPVALLHPLTGFVMIILVTLMGTEFELDYIFIPEVNIGLMKIILLMIGFSIVFIITTLIWTGIVSAPFRRNYNVNGLELAVHALGQFTEQNDNDVNGLEEFFSSFGNSVDVPVGLICLRSKKRVKRNKKFKAILIVPGIHPGPFGYAGGSNLPQKLARELYEYSDNIFVFHSASTHDYNPVKSEEVKKIVAGLKKVLNSDKLEFKSSCSDFVRVSSDGSLQICAQVIGPGLLLTYTSSPKPTDDLDFEIGEQSVKNSVLKYKSAKTAMFIDAHNCLEKGVDSIKFGSKKSNDIQRLVERSLSELGKNRIQDNFRIGLAKNTKFSTREGFGPLGIQVLIIESGDKKVAYVLIDGNNIMPGLRERILKKVVTLVDEAEIFTTDNHVVNITMGGYNPIGLKSPCSKIIKTIFELVSEAIDNLEPVEAGAERKIVKNVNLFGKGNTVRLSRTINKTISRMGKSLAACNLLAIICCFIIYFLVI